MSHLSTIIKRVNNRVRIKDFGSLFEQAVINLMEYISMWDNEYTKEEKQRAIELFDDNIENVKGKGMPSHKDRLKKAKEIRRNL